MRFPVNVINVKQKFSKTHHGIDFGWHNIIGKNQAIMAADDGTVIYNRYQGALSGGYVIIIRHDSGVCTEYGHLLKNSQKVHEGDRVKKGQVIANMGCSGNAVGNHLHFGVYRGKTINYKDKSNWLDPLKYLCMYDNQCVVEDRSIVPAKDIFFTKLVKGTDGTLNIRNKPNTKGKIVGTAKEGSQVESFGNSGNWNIVDNLRNYYCSKKYLK